MITTLHVVDLTRKKVVAVVGKPCYHCASLAITLDINVRDKTMKNPFDNQDFITKQDIEEYRDYILSMDGEKYGAEEITSLNALLDEMGDCEELIKESYFVEYITNIIDDCYDDIKPKNSTHWPYYCVTIDYEMAARDAKVDYSNITYKGVDYLAR
jgi:hypothetical protein